MSRVYVALVANDKYIQHAGVVIASILENAKNPEAFLFYLLCDEISSLNTQKINDLGQRYGSQINLIATSSKQYDHLVQVGYLVSATYLKFNIEDLLPDEVHKVIYIDSDVVVLDDLKALWDIDLGHYALAAAEDPHCDYKKKALKIPDQYAYFNSGVMVMNLDFFRINNMRCKLYEYVENNPEKIDYVDQDAFNALLYDKCKPLSLNWNVLAYFYEREVIEKVVQKNELPLYLKASQEPKIVHYCGKIKPWQYLCLHPKKKLYWQYLNKTSWRDFKTEGKNALSIIVKILRGYKPLMKLMLSVLPHKWVESLKRRIGLI
jgi:lipopolysaccharide biosynthesis glycosyltransferase